MTSYAWQCVYCGGEWSPVHFCTAGDDGHVETLQPVPLIVDDADPESLTEAAAHFASDDEARASRGR